MWALVNSITSIEAHIGLAQAHSYEPPSVNAENGWNTLTANSRCDPIKYSIWFLPQRTRTVHYCATQTHTIFFSSHVSFWRHRKMVINNFVCACAAMCRLRERNSWASQRIDLHSWNLLAFIWMKFWMYSLSTHNQLSVPRLSFWLRRISVCLLFYYSQIRWLYTPIDSFNSNQREARQFSA